MLDFLIKFERISEKNHLFEKVTLFSIFSIGIFLSKDKGRHLGVAVGFLSFEVELTFRSWLEKS